jgi:hypothetical protein
MLFHPIAVSYQAYKIDTYHIFYAFQRIRQRRIQKKIAQRGNTEEFIDIFIGRWYNFMISLRHDAYGAQIIMSEEEYLLDVKEKLTR